MNYGGDKIFRLQIELFWKTDGMSVIINLSSVIILWLLVITTQVYFSCFRDNRHCFFFFVNFFASHFTLFILTVLEKITFLLDLEAHKIARTKTPVTKSAARTMGEKSFFCPCAIAVYHILYTISYCEPKIISRSSIYSHVTTEYIANK